MTKPKLISTFTQGNDSFLSAVAITSGNESDSGDVSLRTWLNTIWIKHLNVVLPVNMIFLWLKWDTFALAMVTVKNNNLHDPTLL